jgi:hypothetical protein
MSTPSDADVLVYIKYLMSRTRLADTLLSLREQLSVLPDSHRPAVMVMIAAIDLLEGGIKKELTETPDPWEPVP